MTIHLSIVLFLPLRRGPGRRRSCRRDGGALGRAGRHAAGARLRDRDAGRLRVRAGGLQYVTDDEWIPELGIRYQLGVDGLNLFMIALTAIAWVPCTLVAAFSELERPRLFFFHLALGRDRGARRVHGAGPGAVHRLLRPDAGAVLLPDRRLGHRRPRARDDQVRDLHAVGLAADAGRRRSRSGVLATPRRRRASRSRSPTSSSAPVARGLAGVDRAAVRARLLREGAAVPAARLGAGDLPLHLDPGAGAALRRAVEGRRLRLPADRAADHARRRPALAGAVHHRRGLLDPLRVGPRVLAGQRAAGARVLVDRPARLHRAGDLRLRRTRAPRARSSRC